MPIAMRIIDELKKDKVNFNQIEETKVAKVLRFAQERLPFSTEGSHKELGLLILDTLCHWRSQVEVQLRIAGL